MRNLCTAPWSAHPRLVGYSAYIQDSLKLPIWKISGLKTRANVTSAQVELRYDAHHELEFPELHKMVPGEGKMTHDGQSRTGRRRNHESHSLVPRQEVRPAQSAAASIHLRSFALCGASHAR